MNWISDLDHRVREWLEGLLTLLADIVIWSEGALVSDSNDWVDATVITNDSEVDNLGLSLFLLIKSLNQKFLILRGAVLPDLVGQNLLKVPKELVVQSTCAIALLAWSSFLVDLLTVALEALWELDLVGDNLFLVHLIYFFWSEDEAAHFLRLAHRIFLACLGLGVDFCVAHHLFVFLFGNGGALRSDLVCLDDSIDVLLISIDVSGVTSEARSVVHELLDHVSSIGGLGDGVPLANDLFVVAAGNGVGLVHLNVSLGLDSLSSNPSLDLRRVLTQHIG